MKETIKRLTPPPVRSLFTRLGRFYATPQVTFPSQEGAFQTLKGLGWNPRTCIDVGAYHGDWAGMFRSIFPDANVLMIEGQDAKEARLKEVAAESAGHIDYAMSLLGAQDGIEVEFAEMETGSSVFEESSPYARHKVKKQLVTLDTLLKRHPRFEGAQSLKLDTQGYEMEVLKGATQLLRTVETVLMEVSLVPINQGAPAFADMVAFMSERNFKLFDFCSQIRRKDGVLWQTDLMFIRKDAGIHIESRLTEDNWAKIK